MLTVTHDPLFGVSELITYHNLHHIQICKYPNRIVACQHHIIDRIYDLASRYASSSMIMTCFFFLHHHYRQQTGWSVATCCYDGWKVCVCVSVCAAATLCSPYLLRRPATSTNRARLLPDETALMQSSFSSSSSSATSSSCTSCVSLLATVCIAVRRAIISALSWCLWCRLYSIVVCRVVYYILSRRLLLPR